MSIKTSSIYTSGNNVYFYSDRVKVFPCAYRNNKYDATARLNTEYNFTHLPHTVDKASYIIKFNDKSKSEPKAELICVIQGYYFEIELGDGDFTTLQNKYLNICVASPKPPEGTDFIEGPHLCSWDKLSSIEGTLDIEQIGGTFFAGLKIGDGVLSNGAGYQCYALKLDYSAKLPIMANKIEDSAEDNAGVPISRKFTTESISTTSLNAKVLNVKNNGSTILEAHSSGITANRAVQIKSKLTSYSLDVIDGTTPVLKAWNEKVNIHKPTYIKGAGSNLIVDGTGKLGGKLTVTAGGTDITGDTQIKKSSSKATDGNLTVAGTGNFGDKLTVSSGGADITGATSLKGTVGITGKTTIGSDSNKTEIENDTIKTSKITIEKASNTGSLVIDKKQDNIIEIKDKSNTTIFSVNTKSGETFAKKINATVEGTSANAVDAKNVTDTIKGTNITDVFGSTSNKIDRLKLRIIEPDTDATWDSGADQSVKIILKKDTDPIKTKAVSFFLAKGDTATVVKADEFIGVAETAQAFNFPATISLSGDVAGKAESKYGWNIQAEIGPGKVTNDKLAGDITNDKLVYDSITIGSNTVALGETVGTEAKPFKDLIYFGDSKNSANDCKLIINGQYKKNEMEFPLEIRSGDISLIKFTNNCGAKDNTSVPKQIIYAATWNDSTQKGRTELFGDKICVYNQGYDYTSGTIEAGTVDLSARSSNAGLKIAKIGQIKVNNVGLKSSTALQIVKSNNYDYVKIGNSSSTINSLLVNGLSEFTSKATFGAGISVTGTAEATTFNAKSDRRLKENIIDYKPEKSILDLPIKKFDFIDGPKNQIGCIAQDLKEICPEIVNENEKGYLSIQENKLVYLLLDEVKKLRNEVEKLKSK